MASWNFWNLTKTFKTTIEVPEPTADSVLTLPSGSQRLAGINDLQPNYRNRIINGAMNVNQINGTTAVTPTATSYISDQWQANISQASKLTFQQVADAPSGFKYSTKVTVASQYSPLATDYFNLQHNIEGQNIIDFKLGTAGAVTINTSLWIKGSVAGTYAVSIRSSTADRSYVGTITVGTSWSKVSINLVGANDGTWNTDNTSGLFLNIDLGIGSNFNTTAGTWQNGNFFCTAGSVKFVNQVAGSTLNITGVQLEKVPTGATQGTDYEWLSYDEEERRCARYLPVIDTTSYYAGLSTSATQAYIAIPFWVKSRIPITGVTLSGAVGGSSTTNGGGTPIALSTLSVHTSQSKGCSLYITVASGLTAGQATLFFSNTNKILFTGAQL